MSSAIQQPDPELIRHVNQLYHDLTQEAFERDHRQRFQVQRTFWEAVAREVLRPSSARGRVVVDLACGTGFVTRTIGRWLGPADRMLAMDVGQAPLESTRQSWERAGLPATTGPELKRLVADAQCLPLADRSVDLVAMNASLHHVPDPRAALRAIRRVLKPGGFFALGFEPNRQHFSSPTWTSLSESVTRACWYASPRQNWRRVRQWTGLGSGGSDTTTGGGEDDVVAAVINERLLAGQRIGEPLSTGQILDLVDPHARGDEEGGGFDPADLIREMFPDYRVHHLTFSDYLGEASRHWPRVRSFVDATCRTLAPKSGSLFSWLVQKPETGSL